MRSFAANGARSAHARLAESDFRRSKLPLQRDDNYRDDKSAKVGGEPDRRGRRWDERDAGDDHDDAFGPAEWAEEEAGDADGKENNADDGRDDGAADIDEAAFEQQRWVKHEDKRHYVGDDAQAHAGPTGFPKIGSSNRCRGVGSDTVRRRDQGQHAEVEKEQMRG